MEPNGIATLEDVARAARVSVSTASRALTGKGQVSRQTIQRVQRAAEKLGYRPNSFARGLKTNSSRLIGLVVHNIINPSYQRLAQVIQEELFRADYQVILCISNDNPEHESLYLDTLIEQRIDGLIIVPTGRNDSKLEEMSKAGIPIVAAIRRPSDHRFRTVLQADADGAYWGTRHLLENGHRRIGLIVGPAETTSGNERFAGYTRALTEFGVPVDPSLVHRGPYVPETGARAAEILLDRPPGITALFSANHEASQGVLRVISERKIVVPDELSLICYEDSPWFSSQRPTITTVDNDPSAIGELAVDLLLKALRDEKRQSDPSQLELRVGARLIIRESTAGAPKGASTA